VSFQPVSLAVLQSNGQLAVLDQVGGGIFDMEPLASGAASSRKATGEGQSTLFCRGFSCSQGLFAGRHRFGNRIVPLGPRTANPKKRGVAAFPRQSVQFDDWDHQLRPGPSLCNLFIARCRSGLEVFRFWTAR